MSSIRSFPPIADKSARVLILGSMPGIASLRARQYYAHPQNAFWPIMGALVGADPQLPYAARTALLTAAGIALWDVLASCKRTSSLDADIEKSTIVVNDFPRFLSRHPGITSIFFNGAMAEQSFLRHAWPQLLARNLQLKRLPSTSPAHASLTRLQKIDAWGTALRERGIIPTPERDDK